MSHRPLTLLLTALLSFAPAAIGAVDARPATAQLGSQVYVFEELAVKKTGNGERRDVAEQRTATLETFECHITTLNAGLESHPPHQHAQEEFIILKEGSLDVFINGLKHRVGPGSIFFFASNDLHNVRNVGEGAATYLVFNVRTAATAQAPATPAAESAPAECLRSGVYNWESLPVTKTDVGLRRALFDAKTVTCENLEGHVTTLNPNATSHAPHRHPDEEVLVMKEGLLDVTINGSTRRIGPGSICFFATNDEHGVKTVGTTPATYYAIRFITAATPKTSSAVH